MPRAAVALHTSRSAVQLALTFYLVSVAIGTPLGLLVARVKVLRTAIAPILSGLQSLPSVAWVPIGILWFGLSPTTIFFVVLLGAVPSIANGTISGVDQVPPLYLRVGTVLGAMVGVHVLIGIGEGVITALTVSAVLASRPDLVWGARHLDVPELDDRRVLEVAR